jgi:biopolymer transport protein ExbD
MRIRDPIQEAEEPFNMIPLTDMVFNLLIFFMAATTFAQVEKEMNLNLPRATQFASLSSIPQDLLININEQGEPIIAREKLNLPALEARVREMVAKNPNANGLVRADKNCRWENVSQVLDTCQRSGVNQANMSHLPAP